MTHTVSYGLDIGRPSASRGAEGSTRSRAVIVGDPTGDLGTAASEAEFVAQTLSTQGMTTRLLLREQATASAVREAIEAPETSLFHYAGHASFAGLDGFQSGLRLVSEGSLGIADILKLSHVPQSVILSGCETGRAPETLELGLAQAFLLAGADAVIATTRPVQDGLARRVVASLYRAGNAAGAWDAEKALQEASRAVMNEDKGGDWQSFRVIVP